MFMYMSYDVICIKSERSFDSVKLPASHFTVKLLIGSNSLSRVAMSKTFKNSRSSSSKQLIDPILLKMYFNVL